MTDNIDTNAIRKLTNAADDGPWTAHSTGLVWAERLGDPVSASADRANSAFIAAARTFVPQLCDEIDRLRAENADLDTARKRLLDRLHNATPDLVTAQQRADQAEDRATDLANRLHHAEQEIASHNKAVTAWANEVQELRDELTAMREKAAKTEREQALVVEFNSRHLIGTPVRYWKGAREGDGKTSKTRTGAQMLSGHTAVVWVEGEGACIALSHIEPLATTAEVA